MKVRGIFAYLYTRKNGYEHDKEDVKQLEFDTKYEVTEIDVRTKFKQF